MQMSRKVGYRGDDDDDAVGYLPPLGGIPLRDAGTSCSSSMPIVKRKRTDDRRSLLIDCFQDNCRSLFQFPTPLDFSLAFFILFAPVNNN
ncbi:hypothetical protein CDAR_450361 [Caerostris darwini]|uniref:Uncharacterized protein n=1 Tax=Caerostris darwini TaxID=1538125 RepID=A0AAV4NFZ5_9ARAC|nr:hypothetical protein CDAR_450361 [Caerostris darwini]